jgi:hypothetical protein
MKETCFSSMLPDYKNILHAPFERWAKDALPGEHNRDNHGPRRSVLLKMIFQFIRHIWRDPPISATENI